MRPRPEAAALAACLAACAAVLAVTPWGPIGDQWRLLHAVDPAEGRVGGWDLGPTSAALVLLVRLALPGATLGTVALAVRLVAASALLLATDALARAALAAPGLRAAAVALVGASLVPILWNTPDVVTAAALAALAACHLGTASPVRAGALAALASAARPEMAVIGPGLLLLVGRAHPPGWWTRALPAFAAVAAVLVLPGLLTHGTDYVGPVLAWEGDRTWFAFAQHFAAFAAPSADEAQRAFVDPWGVVGAALPGADSLVEVASGHPGTYLRYVAWSVRKAAVSMLLATAPFLLPVHWLAGQGPRGAARALLEIVGLVAVGLFACTVVAPPGLRLWCRLEPLLVVASLTTLEGAAGGPLAPERRRLLVAALGSGAALRVAWLLGTWALHGVDARIVWMPDTRI